MAKVLIVEDEKAIVDIISYNLKREGYDVIEAYDGENGLQMALGDDVDLVLLDVMLPLINGFDVLQKIREKSNVPVIVVTAREEEHDKIMGLESGADDYITKPFSVKELLARIKANIRRHLSESEKPAAAEQIKFGPFAIDTQLHSASKNGETLELSQREYDMLCYFISSPQKIVSREELMEKVWGFEFYGDLRAVDVAIRRLREKLESDPADPKHLITKRGSGYFFTKE